MVSVKELQSIVLGVVILLVGFVLIFEVAANLVPTAQTAGDTLCTAGVPLAALFQGDGVIFIVLMAVLLLAAIGLAFGLSIKGGK